MAEEPESLVLTLLRQLDAKVDRMGADLASVKADLTSVKTDVRVHSRTLDILLQEGRLLRAAVNDFAKENGAFPSPRA
jgi:hypothetical protein